MIISSLILVPIDIINPFAYLYITLFFVLLCLPVVAQHTHRKKIKSNEGIIQDFVPGKIVVNNLFCNIVLLITVPLIILSIYKIYEIYGFNILRSISSLLASSGDLAAKRGNSDISMGIWISLASNLSYLCASLLAVRNSSHTLSAVLHFAPAAMVTIFLSQKLILFVSIVLFISYKTANQKMHTDVLKRKSKKPWLLIFMAIFALSFSFISRQGYNPLQDPQALDRLYFIFKSYFVGSLVSFAIFFDDYLNFHLDSVLFEDNWSRDFPIGAFTFGAFVHSLNDITYYKSAGIPDTISSNIFTWFRGLLLDFGIIGSLAFSLLLGIILSMVGKKITKLNLSVTSFIMSTLIISFLISPFIAKYLVVNTVLIYLIILFFGKYDEN